MPAGLGGGWDHARAVGPEARRAVVVVPGSVDWAAASRVTVWPSASSCLTRRRVRCSGGVAAGEPVGAEFAVGDAVGDDVVVGDQDVVVGGAGCFRVAAAAADLPVVGGEVGVLAAGGGVGGLGERGAQPGVAVASFAGAASVAGLVGVGADRGPGDEPLGAAENAHVEAALGDQHLGDVAFHARDGGEQVDQLGVGGGSDAGVERGNCLVERVDVGEQAGDEDAVVGGVEAVGQRLGELRDLRPQPAFGEFGEAGGAADAAEQRL